MRHDLQSRLLEQFCRDRAVMGRGLTLGRAHIGSRPDEAVDLGRDDPASPVVQPEMAFDRRRDLHAVTTGCRTMRDWHHEQDGLLLLSEDGDDDHDRAVFHAFVTTGCFLMTPKIGVREDVTRLGHCP